MDAPIWTRATSGARRRAMPFEVCSAIASQTTALRSLRRLCLRGTFPPRPRPRPRSDPPGRRTARSRRDPAGQLQERRVLHRNRSFPPGRKGRRKQRLSGYVYRLTRGFLSDQVQRCDSEPAVRYPDYRDFTHAIFYCSKADRLNIQTTVAAPDLELRRFSGEALGHLAAVFSNCTGLVKSRAEWRRTGL